MLRQLSLPADAAAVDDLLRRLRLDAADLALLRGDKAEKSKRVADALADVAQRGDAALVDLARRFDDPTFSASKLRVAAGEIRAGHARVPADLLSALRHSIRQVREYQTHILPAPPAPLTRPGFEAAVRWTPLDSVGLYVPGGAASYPSTLIMLAVPAIVAGVKRIVVTTPAGKNLSDAILAVAHELGITELYRAGGVGAVAALALGTATIRPVDKILGPGNDYVQLAKKAVSGAVGTDGYLGPSEILVIADDSADPTSIAADMLAQAEHDPGSCFLVTTSPALLAAVSRALEAQLPHLPRSDAIRRSMENYSAALLCPTEAQMYALANRIACEHVSLRVANTADALAHLRHAGCIFVGDASPVAAGDYVAGPSHCLPTNTTARFASGVSVYDFLKRASVVRYTQEGIAADAPAITTIARAEGLEAHARSVESRLPPR
jgi:histidinol dehydrogenase